MSSRRKMSKKMKQEIGQRIRAARITAGFAMAQDLAAILELDAFTYRRYERGEVVPDVELLARFADETNYTLDWLIAGRGQPQRKE